MITEHEISEAVSAVLSAADTEIAAHGEAGGAVCKNSGRCCKFEEYGHRMYVTGAELVHFGRVHVRSIENKKAKIEDTPADMLKRELRTDELRTRLVSLPQFFAQAEPRGCPYQVAGMCTAREARPLGCRIYFCDERSKAWQNEVYEKYHARLRAVHERFGLAYRYVEWRAGLRELMQTE